jgi:hypothetical protein
MSEESPLYLKISCIIISLHLCQKQIRLILSSNRFAFIKSSCFRTHQVKIKVVVVFFTQLIYKVVLPTCLAPLIINGLRLGEFSNVVTQQSIS